MFRQEAINHHRNKWRGRVLLLGGIPFWSVAGVCILFLGTFLIFVISGNYTRRINVNGEVSTFPHVSCVYSSVQGRVVRQFVTEGQVVNAGDPVYQIDVSKSTRSGVVSDIQSRDIDKQLERITQIISQLKNSKQTTISMLEKQKAQYTDAFNNSRDILRNAREGLRIMKGNMDNYRQYQTRGLINKDQLNNQISLYYQQQNSLLGLSGQNEQNALQITILEGQIHTREADFDNQINQMELKYYELQKERINVDVSGEIIVRSPAGGRIDSLNVTVGQMVNIGDSLLQVVPQKIEHYMLVLWVPNDAIPYIAVGDRANVRYEAFPAEKFGQFSGVVSSISRTPASLREMQTYQGAPTAAVPYYKVMLRPDLHSINYNGQVLNLENGMKAQGTLFLEKRRIYQWMISPFYDMKHSMMGLVNE